MSLPNLPLISAKQLHEHRKQPNLVILDASIPPVGGAVLPQNRWPKVSIANARRMDINEVFSDKCAPYPHTLLSPDAFQRACQELGINSADHIVVYDDLGLFSAARAWWMLLAMGHKQVSVLDGGLPAWLEQGYPTETAALKPVSKGNFITNFNPDLLCDYHAVHRALANTEVLVVDARAAVRFYGREAEPRPGVRAGHMPGAKNLPYASLLNNRLMCSSEQLKQTFKQLNPDAKPMIMTCGSGITACILALAATMVGYEAIQVYDGSWSEWGSITTLPVTTD